MGAGRQLRRDPQAQVLRQPPAFNWGGRSEFASGGENIMDRFPDGDGNYCGPVEKPGATPPDHADHPARRRWHGPAAHPPTTTAPRRS